jgi:type I restriction enzyme S subunit
LLFLVYHIPIVSAFFIFQIRPNSTKVLDFPIPLPPLEGQLEIVEFLQERTKTYDNAISKVQSQIELLKEYRTRLISDVVTGQIDVRDVAIPDYEPEEDGESEEPECKEPDTEESAEA